MVAHKCDLYLLLIKHVPLFRVGDKQDPNYRFALPVTVHCIWLNRLSVQAYCLCEFSHEVFKLGFLVVMKGEILQLRIGHDSLLARVLAL